MAVTCRPQVILSADTTPNLWRTISRIASGYHHLALRSMPMYSSTYVRWRTGQLEILNGASRRTDISAPFTTKSSAHVSSYLLRGETTVMPIPTDEIRDQFIISFTSIHSRLGFELLALRHFHICHCTSSPFPTSLLIVPVQLCRFFSSPLTARSVPYI